jgi:hypothetical protein
MKEEEVKALQILVQKTHARNKKLRLWGSPDNSNVCFFLNNL